jgi:hypothetical protein
MQNPRIFACNGTVVTYQFAPTTDSPMNAVHAILEPEKTDAKLRQILQANPNADLTEFERIFHINILNVQLAKPDPQKDLDDDVPIGDVI